MSFITPENHLCGLTVQVADEAETLIAPSDLTAAGNIVTLGKEHGTIENQATGKKIHLPKRGKVYVLRMWIPGEASSPDKSGFTRRGEHP